MDVGVRYNFEKLAKSLVKFFAQMESHEPSGKRVKKLLTKFAEYSSTVSIISHCQKVKLLCAADII